MGLFIWCNRQFISGQNPWTPGSRDYRSIETSKLSYFLFTEHIAAITAQTITMRKHSNAVCFNPRIRSSHRSRSSELVSSRPVSPYGAILMQRGLQLTSCTFLSQLFATVIRIRFLALVSSRWLTCGVCFVAFVQANLSRSGDIGDTIRPQVPYRNSCQVPKSPDSCIRCESYCTWVQSYPHR